jgi:hypothetical protein
MTENCKFRRAILSAFYNISQRNFGQNITNFVMLFQAVIKFLSKLVWIKIFVIRGKSIVSSCKLRGIVNLEIHVTPLSVCIAYMNTALSCVLTIGITCTFQASVSHV